MRLRILASVSLRAASLPVSSLAQTRSSCEKYSMEANDVRRLSKGSAGDRCYEPNDVLGWPIRSHDHICERGLNFARKLG